MKHSVTTRRDVSRFLTLMKEKLRSGGRIVFVDRNKNSQALFELGITPSYREQIIKSLEVEDYSEGPNEDTIFNSGKPLWVFGKMFNEQEIYIKIHFGVGLDTICISFHKAEKSLNYPFRKEDDKY